MSKHFNDAPVKKLREYQKKAAFMKSVHHTIRCSVAHFIFEEYGDVRIVEDFFKVGREQAYKMVAKGRVCREQNQHTEMRQV